MNKKDEKKKERRKRGDAKKEEIEKKTGHLKAFLGDYPDEVI